MRRIRWTIVIALGLAGCTSGDLGAPCRLLRADGTEIDPRPGHATLQSGNGECEQFACVSFDGSAAVCSRPCNREGQPCEAGFVCRATMLDPASLAALRQTTEGRDEDGDGVDDFQQLASGLRESLYCGPP